MSAGNSKHEEIMSIVQSFPDCSDYKEKWETALLEIKKDLEEKFSLIDLLNKALDALKTSRNRHAVICVEMEAYVEASLLRVGKRSFGPTVERHFSNLTKAANALLNPRGWKLEQATSLTRSGVAGSGLFFYVAGFEVCII